MILRVVDFKWDYRELLLLGDESLRMIATYLDRGDLFVLEAERAARAVCVVTDEGGGVAEVKNLAVAPEFQRQGYGRLMLAHAEAFCRGRFARLQVGTGESPRTLSFYRGCGYRYHHRIPNFFTENYDGPIVEDGVLLRDMVYFSKTLI